jgi:prolyl oligopeptidase
VLPNPADTCPAFNHSHCAWIANQQGPHAAGALVLCRHDGGETRVLFTPAARLTVRSDDVFFIGDWLIWIEMRELAPHLMVLDVRDPEAIPHEIKPPVAAEALWINTLDANEDIGDGTLVLTVTGFLAPPQKWLFDLSRGVEGIVFRPFLYSKARFDASGCQVRVWVARSEDGTEVPYHIVLPKGHEGRHDLPVLQYGYGGFGFCLAPSYDSLIGKFWIETGAAYVQAYIRGGGEFGPDWHNQAKGGGRHLAFADFAAVAADLVARGITTPERIACYGASNGGLLCGVMLTRYPERFGAVWSSVGVHDMLNYTRFPAGRGWIDEYGDPEDKQARESLRSYSPIHNIPQKPLPSALIDTNHRDDRVDPSHSRRFAAALRAAGHQPFYLEHQGGHGGGGASYETAREMSFGLAFLRHALRIDDQRD